MKVTDVNTFLVDPVTNKNWLFIRVETDEGISLGGIIYYLGPRGDYRNLCTAN